jgi:hypothetical protein
MSHISLLTGINYYLLPVAMVTTLECTIENMSQWPGKRLSCWVVACKGQLMPAHSGDMAHYLHLALGSRADYVPPDGH